MGREVRRGKRCYYRKVREGRKVRSVYCGSGERGEAAAAEDTERLVRGCAPAPSRHRGLGRPRRVSASGLPVDVTSLPIGAVNLPSAPALMPA